MWYKSESHVGLGGTTIPPSFGFGRSQWTQRWLHTYKSLTAVGALYFSRWETLATRNNIYNKMMRRGKRDMYLLSFEKREECY